MIFELGERLFYKVSRRLESEVIVDIIYPFTVKLKVKIGIIVDVVVC